MSKSKFAFMTVGALVSAIALTGCSFCRYPMQNDVRCVKPSHDIDKETTPNVLRYTAPNILPCTDYFRPTFRPGTQRVTVVGIGPNKEQATRDAIAKFLDKVQCDYIVAVSLSFEEVKHPRFWWFSSENCSVTLSGMPLFIDKLVKVEAPAKPLPPPPPNKELIKIVKETVKESVKENNTIILKEIQKGQPLGLLKLSDIKVQIQANGNTNEKAGVVFPAQ